MKNEKNGLIYYTSDLLTKKGFIHGFFTSCGGVSEGDFSSLNVSLSRKDSFGRPDKSENVLENYRLALSVLGTKPENCVGTNQVHENNVIFAADELAGHGIIPDLDMPCGCDGVAIDDKSAAVEAVAVKTADCVPILLCNAKTGSVAAVHAGWRGTASGIAVKGVEKLLGDKKDIFCAIGPSIGPCCYTVGKEVYESMKKLFRNLGIKEERLEEAVIYECICSSNFNLKINLPLINKILLTETGVPTENIDVIGICTRCNDEFFSHRRSGGFSGTFPSVILKRKQNEQK